METNKPRNRTVRRYHRSMKTGEVLPCVAVREEDCRAEHLTERQAFEAAKAQAHEMERRKQEKDAKKAESRRRRREAQTAYMRKWRARKAAMSERVERRQKETQAVFDTATAEGRALPPVAAEEVARREAWPTKTPKSKQFFRKPLAAAKREEAKWGLPRGWRSSGVQVLVFDEDVVAMTMASPVTRAFYDHQLLHGRGEKWYLLQDLERGGEEGSPFAVLCDAAGVVKGAVWWAGVEPHRPSDIHLY